MPTPPRDAKSFTFAILVLFCDGDEVLAREVATLMLCEIAKAQRLVEAADREGRRQAAHGIKGAALNCGAEALARRAAELEIDVDDTRRRNDLLTELERVRRALLDPASEGASGG